MAALSVALTPSQQIEDMPIRREDSSLATTFLYKGHEEGGVLGSRLTPMG